VRIIVPIAPLAGASLTAVAREPPVQPRADTPIDTLIAPVSVRTGSR